MPTDNEDSGFLSRWSRRKVLVRQGAAVADAPAPAAGAADLLAPKAASAVVIAPSEPHATPSTAEPVARAAPAEPAAPPLPTLADVAALTRDSDFSRFVGRSVQPEVKNAALTKLFTDPHFNVMDGLDTYIDDYGKPDPLPEGMLRQMVQSQFLGLFDDEKKTDEPAAESAAPAPADPKEEASNEDADLRLQQDDAAGRREPPQGARA